MKLTRRKLLIGGAGITMAPGVAGLVASPDGPEIEAVRDVSLWSHETPALPDLPQYKDDAKADLVIVGSGYTGLSCAYYVKKQCPDWRVIILESHMPGSGASTRNSGAVYAKQVGISDPDFPKRGLTRFRNFLERENIDCDFVPTPTLFMARSHRQLNALEKQHGPGSTLISGEVLKARIGTSYYRGASVAADYFTLHPVKLFQGLLRAVLDLGVEVYQHSPVLEVQQGQPAQVITPNGHLTAKNVLIATNAYTPRLGFKAHHIFPVHQYSLATRKLSDAEIKALGLDIWPLRFEENILPVTFGLTPSGHFFVRMVIGYASFNSTNWKNLEGAKRLARRVFMQRYPMAADLGIDFGWHGVTAHTANARSVFDTIGHGNVHVSAAYNGLGIMPAHNSGYLTACQITDTRDDDIARLQAASTPLYLPGDMYRSLMFKPFMKLATPV